MAARSSGSRAICIPCCLCARAWAGGRPASRRSPQPASRSPRLRLEPAVSAGRAGPSPRQPVVAGLLLGSTDSAMMRRTHPPGKSNAAGGVMGQFQGGCKDRCMQSGRASQSWLHQAGDGAEAPERLPPEGGLPWRALARKETPTRRFTDTDLPAGVPASGSVDLLAPLHSFLNLESGKSGNC